MLDWLKGKLKQGNEAGERILIAKAVQVHFASLEKIKTVTPGIVKRLANFVASRDDEKALNEIVLPGAGRQSGIEQVIYFGGQTGRFSKGLSSLLKVFPHDAELYLRLALAYEAISQAGYPTNFVRPSSSIPGFQGSHRWLSTFLEELSDAGPKDQSYFPVSLVESMLVAKNEDSSILVRGAFIVQDQQGKNQCSRWVRPPYRCFRCLTGFESVASRWPEIVREALHQTDAGARA